MIKRRTAINRSAPLGGSRNAAAAERTRAMRASLAWSHEITTYYDKPAKLGPHETGSVPARISAPLGRSLFGRSIFDVIRKHNPLPLGSCGLSGSILGPPNLNRTHVCWCFQQELARLYLGSKIAPNRPGAPLTNYSQVNQYS